MPEPTRLVGVRAEAGANSEEGRAVSIERIDVEPSDLLDVAGLYACSSKNSFSSSVCHSSTVAPSGANRTHMAPPPSLLLPRRGRTAHLLANSKCCPHEEGSSARRGGKRDVCLEG